MIGGEVLLFHLCAHISPAGPVIKTMSQAHISNLKCTTALIVIQSSHEIKMDV